MWVLVPGQLDWIEGCLGSWESTLLVWLWGTLGRLAGGQWTKCKRGTLTVGDTVQWTGCYEGTQKQEEAHGPAYLALLESVQVLAAAITHGTSDPRFFNLQTWVTPETPKGASRPAASDWGCLFALFFSWGFQLLRLSSYWFPQLSSLQSPLVGLCSFWCMRQEAIL
jgi:hypothetical protein